MSNTWNNGRNRPEDAIAAISPYLTEHINRFGDYTLNLAGNHPSQTTATLSDGPHQSRETKWPILYRIVAIPRLGRDLQARFPGVEGFSPRNLKYMRSFAEAWPDPEIVPQRVALLPWGHLRLLLDRVKDPAARDWYLLAAVREGWNRDALGHMIEGRLYAREGKSLTNFGQTLPPEQSEMAVQVLRDPYNFDFLTLTHPLEERKLERGLLTHMRDLLLELGRGFAFVGSQVPITVGEETFYLDLLFYHVRLHCYFVLELKVGKFKPEYAGKLNFYLSAVDGMMRTTAPSRLLLADSTTPGSCWGRGKWGLSRGERCAVVHNRRLALI